MYQKREIGELGNLEFIGTIGSLAEFEDVTGKGYNEVFREGQLPKFGDIIAFVYCCYKVAQIRQGKGLEISLDQFKANAENTVVELFGILMQDAVGKFSEPEKKISKQIKK